MMATEMGAGQDKAMKLILLGLSSKLNILE